jgi:hypothetical protein
MSESSTQRPPDSAARDNRRRDGQHTARAQRPTRRAIAAIAVILLVALALAVVVIVRNSSTSLDLGQRCGTIYSGQPAIPTSAADVHADITCFVQAYARCSTASLTSIHNFGDGETQDTFVVVPGQGLHSACGLMDEWGTTIIGGNRAHSGQEHCARLTQQGDTLTFHSCGTIGDVTVPPGT